MSLTLALSLTVLAAYLLGSINSALLVSRFLVHDDVRAHGSGNAGMANVLRTFGKKPALFTALGDVLKAVLAVLLGRLICSGSAAALPLDPGYLAGLFVIVGHIYPVYFRFKGGKGVLAAFGVILMVNLPAFAVLLVIAGPIFWKTRTMSLVSVLSAAILPPLTWILCRLRQVDPLYETLMATVYTLLVLYAHRANIKRLLNRTEKPLLPKSRP